MLNWQTALANCITDPKILWERLELDPKDLVDGYLAQKDFPLRVPEDFVARMKKGDPQDPLLLQVLPKIVELQTTPGYSKDALQEKNKNPIPGLLQKYEGRVLLTVTSGCAIHCRYCFRRHFPYETNVPSIQNWQPVMDYIRADPNIHEVILSGGDPLVVKDSVLEELVDALEKIPHLTTLRIHTRLPIMIPSRVTNALLNLFSKTRFQVVMVIHCNHAQELDENVLTSLNQLRDAKVTLLNQSVLLRGINDNADTLIALSRALFSSGVLPYYLHLLDPVQGAAHFDVDEIHAKELMKIVVAQLPGYLVPRLARETPGETAKTVVF